MTRATIGLPEHLHEYLLSVSSREVDALRRLREETASHPRAEMQIAPEQGQLMALLVRLIGARRTIELGVFTGYSSIAVALALPEDGIVVACDTNEEYVEVARRYWREADVERKIDFLLGPALETLDGLLEGGEAGMFDFAFFDADKREVGECYERLLRLVRKGGLIVVDNTLWGGSVAEPPGSDDDESVIALRRFNEKIHHDERVDLAFLPLADGLTLARVR